MFLMNHLPKLSLHPTTKWGCGKEKLLPSWMGLVMFSEEGKREFCDGMIDVPFGSSLGCSIHLIVVCLSSPFTVPQDSFCCAPPKHSFIRALPYVCPVVVRYCWGSILGTLAKGGMHLPLCYPVLLNYLILPKRFQLNFK